MAIQTYTFENSFKIEFINDDFKSLNNSIIRANIPSIDVGLIEIQTPIKNIYSPGDSFNIESLTLEYILDEDYQNWRTIFNWIIKNKNPHLFDSDMINSNIQLNIVDNKYNSVFGIVFEKCFPISLSGLSLNTQIESPETVFFSCTFSVENIYLIN